MSDGDRRDVAYYIYQDAWKLLRKRIEAQTSWGKNQLDAEMASCLERSIEMLIERSRGNGPQT